MFKKHTNIIMIVCVALCSSMLTCIFHHVSFSVKYGDALQKIMAVKRIIADYGMYEADEETLGDYGAMGLTAAVEDPYTAYYPEKEFASYMTEMQTTYIGVGAIIGANTQQDCLVIISPMDNSPAEKAGVRPGDLLKAIDGEAYNSMQLSDASFYLKKGEIGSKVTVTIERDGETFDLVIERDRIIKETVSSKMVENNIGYIRISEFDYSSEKENKNTAEEFKDHYESLKSAGMERLIIDLRNNPGGEIGVACSIADMLLPEGTITYTEDKRGRRETYKSDKEECTLPMVVLVNGGSASASEIVTSALKDYNKATIVGTKTYGKGIVQTVIPFTDGSGMSITIAKYYTPNGKCIHQVGIEPDVTVKMDTDKSISNLEYNEDIQLKKAVELLSSDVQDSNR